MKLILILRYLSHYLGLPWGCTFWEYGLRNLHLQYVECLDVFLPSCFYLKFCFRYSNSEASVFSWFESCQKYLATRWKPPHSFKQYWVLTIIDVAYLEIVYRECEDDVTPYVAAPPSLEDKTPLVLLF